MQDRSRLPRKEARIDGRHIIQPRPPGEQSKVRFGVGGVPQGFVVAHQIAEALVVVVVEHDGGDGPGAASAAQVVGDPVADAHVVVALGITVDRIAEIARVDRRNAVYVRVAVHQKDAELVVDLDHVRSGGLRQVLRIGEVVAHDGIVVRPERFAVVEETPLSGRKVDAPVHQRSVLVVVAPDAQGIAVAGVVPDHVALKQRVAADRHHVHDGGALLVLGSDQPAARIGRADRDRGAAAEHQPRRGVGDAQQQRIVVAGQVHGIVQIARPGDRGALARIADLTDDHPFVFVTPGQPGVLRRGDVGADFQFVDARTQFVFHALEAPGPDDDFVDLAVIVIPLVAVAAAQQQKECGNREQTALFHRL